MPCICVLIGSFVRKETYVDGPNVLASILDEDVKFLIGKRWEQRTYRKKKRRNRRIFCIFSDEIFKATNIEVLLSTTTNTSTYCPCFLPEVLHIPFYVRLCLIHTAILLWKMKTLMSLVLEVFLEVVIFEGVACFVSLDSSHERCRLIRNFSWPKAMCTFFIEIVLWSFSADVRS